MVFSDSGLRQESTNARSVFVAHDLNIDLAIRISGIVGLIGIIGAAGGLLLALVYPRYPQFPGLAGVAVLFVLGAGSCRLLIRRGQKLAGGVLMALLMPLALFLAPLALPLILPAAAAGFVIWVMMGFTLAGSSAGSAGLVFSLLALTVDVLLAQSRPAGILATTPLEVATPWLAVVVNVPAVLGFILAGRVLITWYREALASERALLRAVIDTMPDTIYVKDTQSRMLVANATQARLMGVASPDELIGKTDADFFPPEFAEKYLRDEQEIFQKGESRLNIGESVIDQEGNRHWFLSTKMILRGADGSVQGLVGMGRNVTALKTAEEDRERLLEREQEQRQMLEAMIAQIRSVVMRLNAAAVEILAATTQQASSVVQQESSVTQTVATVEEVRMTVAQTSERAQRVAGGAQESVEITRAGQQAVSDTIASMAAIRERVESIAETILALSERMQQIEEIIATVNEIADQSKLLALNASIEAARAGEEGKGFAVVAMEVRQMAERSREATKRVSDILHEIQRNTNTAVMVTEDGAKEVEQGRALALRAGESIDHLTATIESAAQAATQIAASTQQQMNGMEQLLSAMQVIRQASIQSAGSARQTEESARELKEMARELDEMVQSRE